MTPIGVWGTEIVHKKQEPFSGCPQEMALRESILLAIANVDKMGEQDARLAYAAWLRKINTPESIRRAERQEQLARPN